MPISSIVRRSASRICAAFRTRIDSRAYCVCETAVNRGQASAATRHEHSPRSIASGRRTVRRYTSSTMRGAVNVNGTIVRSRHAVDPGVRSRLPLRRRRLRDAAHLQRPAVPVRPAHARGCAQSARMLALAVPFDDATLARAVRRDDAAAGRARGGDEAYIRILVTRGVGELTYDSGATPDAVASSSSSSRTSTAPADVYERRRRDRARRHRAQPSRIGEPADQVEQPAEQRAGDAGGVSPRRVRRGADAQLPRRAGRVHAVEPLHRQGRRGADAAARRRAAAGHHARVPVRGRRRTSASTVREATLLHDATCSTPTKRSSPARRASSCPSSGSTIASIGTGTPGPVTHAAAGRLSAQGAGVDRALSESDVAR